MFGWLKRRRREAVRRRAFPEAWHAVIEKNVPYAARLPLEDRQELLGHVQVFLAEKRFEGCGGLAITDEIRVTIAAQACLLLLHRDTDYYPRLASILVYPDDLRRAGRAARSRTGSSPMRAAGPPRRVVGARRGGPGLGRRARPGASDIHDGHNVVLHEFAHQLDQEDGAADGAPDPRRRQPMYVAWARVLGPRLRSAPCGETDAARTERPRPATGRPSPAEFFAVVTETFFEKPRQLALETPGALSPTATVLPSGSGCAGDDGASMRANDPHQSEVTETPTDAQPGSLDLRRRRSLAAARGRPCSLRSWQRAVRRRSPPCSRLTSHPKDISRRPWPWRSESRRGPSSEQSMPGRPSPMRRRKGA